MNNSKEYGVVGGRVSNIPFIYAGTSQDLMVFYYLVAFWKILR